MAAVVYQVDRAPVSIEIAALNQGYVIKHEGKGWAVSTAEEINAVIMSILVASKLS